MTSLIIVVTIKSVCVCGYVYMYVGMCTCMWVCICVNVCSPFQLMTSVSCLVQKLHNTSNSMSCYNHIHTTRTCTQNTHTHTYSTHTENKNRTQTGHTENTHCLATVALCELSHFSSPSLLHAHISPSLSFSFTFFLCHSLPPSLPLPPSLSLPLPLSHTLQTCCVYIHVCTAFLVT